MSNEITPVTSANLPATTDFQSQVSPEALAELFARDPEKLNDQDVTIIVVELRKQRQRFEADEDAKALKPKKPRTSSTDKSKSVQMSLEDLGL